MKPREQQTRYPVGRDDGTFSCLVKILALKKGKRVEKKCEVRMESEKKRKEKKRKEMLKGRESVVRLVGKRRRFLPNRETLLSASDDLELVTCPVCALKISAQHHAINSHLGPYSIFSSLHCLFLFVNYLLNYFSSSSPDTCLSESSETPTGAKRKLSQRTLLDSNFLSKSKIHQSQLTNNDDFCGSHSNSHIINDVVVVVAPKAKAAAADVDVTIENVSGVTLQTFIVGRRFFSHENELHVGANISLLPDPHNVKDPNAIKVTLLS